MERRSCAYGGWKGRGSYQRVQAILEDGLDGPAIRADLAVLAAKRGDDSAVEHARKAIVLGVSEDKVKEMEVVIS